MVGAIPQKVYGLLYFVKYKNDNIMCTCKTLEAIGCLIFELSKLRFRAYTYLMDYLKGADNYIKCIYR